MLEKLWKNCIFYITVFGGSGVCYCRNYLLMEIEEFHGLSVLTLVVAVWTMYGIYIGFLQFMVSYTNKENGVYLGYQKMMFLAKRNETYHFVNSYRFLVLLIASVILPIVSGIIKVTPELFLCLWQVVICYLLIIFICLLKFSVNVVGIMLEINEDTDENLKDDIKRAISVKYKKIYEDENEEKFSQGNRKKFFKELDEGLKCIHKEEEKIEYLKQVFDKDIFSVFLKENSEKKEKKNFKKFLMMKYDFLSKMDFDNKSEFISFVKDQFKEDVEELEKLIKKDVTWIELEYTNIPRSLAPGSANEHVTNNGLRIIRRLVSPVIALYKEDQEIEKIHINIFERVKTILKKHSRIEELLNIVNEVQPNMDSFNKRWLIESEREKRGIEILEDGSKIKINNIRFRKIENFNICGDYKIEDEVAKRIKFLDQGINEITFEYDNKKYKIKNTKLKEYFRDFEEYMLNSVFDSFFCCENKLNGVVGKFHNKFKDKKRYSEICFKFLLEKYESTDIDFNKNQATKTLMNSMDEDYKGVFSLYLLNKFSDSDCNSVQEEYLLFLKKALQRKESIKKMRKIINSMHYETRERDILNKTIRNIVDKSGGFRNSDRIKLDEVKKVLIDTRKYH